MQSYNNDIKSIGPVLGLLEGCVSRMTAGSCVQLEMSASVNRHPRHGRKELECLP